MKPWDVMTFEERVKALGIKPGSLLAGGKDSPLIFRKIMEIDMRAEAVYFHEGNPYSLNVVSKSYYKAINSPLEIKLYDMSNKSG